MLVLAFSLDALETWALTWLPIIFMGLIVVVIGMTLRHMPRTKPQEIKPDDSASTPWEDVAGVEEAKAELRAQTLLEREALERDDLERVVQGRRANEDSRPALLEPPRVAATERPEPGPGARD